jgi:hypothetical protein
VDDVKRLLEQFADRAVDGVPPADVDADVARGRRALRRIKARRRVTGVLVVAAATTAVLAVGDHEKWWGGGATEVATKPATPDSQSAAPTAQASPAAPSAQASPAETDETMSLFSGPTVHLVANQQTWISVGCTLAPEGWSAQATADRVVLTPPSARTADVSARLELFPSDQPQSLSGIRAVETGGKVFHVGSTGGREVGQVKLGDRWLVARLPVEHQDWTDDVVRRFLDSCTVS